MAKETTPLDAEEARARAAQCREEAKLTGNPQHKIMLEHMAGTWDRISETFECGDGDGRKLLS